MAAAVLPQRRSPSADDLEGYIVSMLMLASVLIGRFKTGREGCVCMRL